MSRERHQDSRFANEKTGKICCARLQHDTIPSQWALVITSATHTSGWRCSIRAQSHYEEQNHTLPRFPVPSWLNYGQGSGRGGRREAGGKVKQPPTTAVVRAFWRLDRGRYGIRAFRPTKMNQRIVGWSKRGLMRSSRMDLRSWCVWSLGSKEGCRLRDRAVAKEGPSANAY